MTAKGSAGVPKEVKLMMLPQVYAQAEAAARHEGDTVTDTISRAVLLYHQVVTSPVFRTIDILDRYDGQIMRWVRVK